MLWPVMRAAYRALVAATLSCLYSIAACNDMIVTHVNPDRPIGPLAPRRQ